jgi:hypothetical protein
VSPLEYIALAPLTIRELLFVYVCDAVPESVTAVVEGEDKVMSVA